MKAIFTEKRTMQITPYNTLQIPNLGIQKESIKIYIHNFVILFLNKVNGFDINNSHIFV